MTEGTTKQIIHTDRAPAAIGTYSQAVRVGQIVYLSGQIPLHPTTMEIVEGGIQAQIAQVFANIQALCEAAGGALAQLVKLQVYLIDLQHFPLVNEAMTALFTAPYPARAVIEVSKLPRGALIEIDGILSL